VRTKAEARISSRPEPLREPLHLNRRPRSPVLRSAPIARHLDRSRAASSRGAAERSLYFSFCRPIGILRTDRLQLFEPTAYLPQGEPTQPLHRHKPPAPAHPIESTQRNPREPRPFALRRQRQSA
jgi:hypothetical protein